MSPAPSNCWCQYYGQYLLHFVAAMQVLVLVMTSNAVADVKNVDPTGIAKLSR